MRYRENSGRRLLLYRVAVGQPGKRAIAGTFGKVEILGRGQQLSLMGSTSAPDCAGYQKRRATYP